MAHRDTKGRFLTGNGESKGFGRPMERHKREMQEAFAKAFPPEVIIGWILEAVEIAIEQKAAKTIINAASEVLDRTIGKAVVVETPPESDQMMAMIEHWSYLKSLRVVEESTEKLEESVAKEE